MKEADYYTVMERRIQYYARKYDPGNKYAVRELSSASPDIPRARRSVREKVVSGFGYIFSILF
jgi:hypothetical protein